MQTGSLVSIREYVTTDYSPDCDYVDGEVLERNVGEKGHSSAQMYAAAYLFNHRKEWGIWVYPEQRVQVSATRFRIPDICVIAGPEPEEEIFTHPPFICIEILSPEDRTSRMNQRIQDYLSFGVKHVWLIDPRNKQAFVCTEEGWREVKDALRAENPDVVLPLSEIFQ